MNNCRFSAEALFLDSRQVLDVKHDLEKKAYQLFPRDLTNPAVLVFRGTSRRYTTGGETTFELRLESAYDTENLYAFRLTSSWPSNPANDEKWRENLRTSFERFVSGLTVTEARKPSSPERYRQVVEETLAREAAPPPEDPEAIRVIQERILDGLRRGKLFFTAHHEGGTKIHFLKGKFVVEDYGESTDREEFSSAEPFLARLRKFYDWESRKGWMPHAPPELEVWTFIQGELRE